MELARQAVSEVLNGGLPDAYALSFTEAAPGAHLTVAGDPALLSRMLANLLHNCVDHNPGGCSIEVMVGPAQAGGCVFTVADDGAGVSADKLPADRAADRPRPPRPAFLCYCFAPRPGRAGVDRRKRIKTARLCKLPRRPVDGIFCRSDFRRISACILA